MFFYQIDRRIHRTKISPLKNKREQAALLANVHFEKIDHFKNISNVFYTIKFIYCIMYLLIVEEKTSSATAHMFKKLLEKYILFESD